MPLPAAAPRPPMPLAHSELPGPAKMARAVELGQEDVVTACAGQLVAAVGVKVGRALERAGGVYVVRAIDSDAADRIIVAAADILGPHQIPGAGILGDED